MPDLLPGSVPVEDEVEDPGVPAGQEGLAGGDDSRQQLPAVPHEGRRGNHPVVP